MTEKCTDHDRVLVLEAEFREYRYAMEARLAKLNELREQVESDRSSFMRSDVYLVQHEELKKMLADYRNQMTKAHDLVRGEVIELGRWQARIIGIGLALTAITTLIGVAIGAVLSHVWR
jgi:hypothetical protein